MRPDINQFEHPVTVWAIVVIYARTGWVDAGHLTAEAASRSPSRDTARLIGGREHRDDDDRAAADVWRSAILRYLTVCCTALDPTYALLHIEGHTSSPAALAAGKRIGGDVFVSRRLAGRADLGARLAEVARWCETPDWDTGTFYSGDFLAQRTGTRSWPLGRLPRRRSPRRC